MSYPIKWVSVSDELERQRLELFEEGSTHLKAIVSEPYGVHAAPAMAEAAKKVYNFKVRPDDVWIVTYPKCGTTWTQEMVWQIVNKIDTDKARKVPLYVRSPFLELEGLMRPENLATILAAKGVNVDEPNEEATYLTKLLTQTIQLAEEAPSPRVFKTHLPIDMLPPNLLDTCKVIFVCRNPKDCCVSLYHHYSLFPEYKFKGTFAEFAQLFMEGTLEFGGYWTMFKSAWKHKDHPNLKIMWYEDMKKDLITVIKDVTKFIGYHLTELKVLQLDDHLYIDNFREVLTEGFKDPKWKQFCRKGEVGDWKNYFNEENNKIWDKWIAENMKGTNIKWPEIILNSL